MRDKSGVSIGDSGHSMRIKMKKYTILFILASIIFVLTGCGGKKGQESKSIVIWHDKEEEVIEVLEKHLKETVADVTVQFEKKTGLTESLKLVGNDSSSSPDMFIFAHDKLGVYAEMGILSPISEFIEKEDLSDYIPLTISSSQYDGEIYQLPLYFETLLFVYNKKYMSDAQVPKTTEELYGYMVAKTKYGHYGFVEQHSTPYYAVGWVHAFGTDYISSDGVPLFDTEEMKSALAYHKKFVSLMPGETEYATVNTLFLEGMAHTSIVGPWFVPSIKAKGIDVGFAPMPVVESTGQNISPYCGVQGIHVLKVHAEEKKEEITRVLKALMDPVIGIDLALSTGAAPARLASYENEEVKKNELVMLMRQTAESAKPMPNIPEMDPIFVVAGNLLTDINMSGMDIEEATQKAQKKALELIGNMR